MKFSRRLITQRDVTSVQTPRVLLTHPIYKGMSLELKESVRLLTIVLGEEFAIHLIEKVADRMRLSLVLGSIDVSVDLFKREYEEDESIDLQTTMAVVALKSLFPFNAKKLQSRVIEVRRFLRDFEGWSLEYRKYLEELLVTDRHLDNRGSIYLFGWTA